MASWGIFKANGKKPDGNAAEIERLRKFVRSKTDERAKLIGEVREIEAKVNVVLADLKHEPSRAVRAIRQDVLSELLAGLKAIDKRAIRITQAIAPAAQLIETYESLAVDREAAVTADQVDRAIADFEEVMDGRRDAAEALRQLGAAEEAASSPRQSERCQEALPAQQRLTDPNSPAALPEPLRQSLRDAGFSYEG